MADKVDILKELSNLHLSAQELDNLKKEIDAKKGERATIQKDIDILKKALEEQKRLNEIEQSEHLKHVGEIKGTVGKLVAEKDKVEMSTKLSMKELEDKKEEIEKLKNSLVHDNEKYIDIKNRIQRDNEIINNKSKVIKQIVDLAKSL